MQIELKYRYEYRNRYRNNAKQPQLGSCCSKLAPSTCGEQDVGAQNERKNKGLKFSEHGQQTCSF